MHWVEVRDQDTVTVVPVGDGAARFLANGTPVEFSPSRYHPYPGGGDGGVLWAQAHLIGQDVNRSPQRREQGRRRTEARARELDRAVTRRFYPHLDDAGLRYVEEVRWHRPGAGTYDVTIVFASPLDDLFLWTRTREDPRAGSSAAPLRPHDLSVSAGGALLDEIDRQARGHRGADPREAHRIGLEVAVLRHRVGDHARAAIVRQS